MKLPYYLCLFLLLSCGSDDSEPVTPPVGPFTSIGSTVKNYLDEVIAIMEENSINKNNIDWNDFRDQVFDEAGTIQFISEADEALRLALRLLEDNHSIIIKSNGNALVGQQVDCSADPVEDVSTPDNVGYLKVDFFPGGSVEQNEEFASGLQDQISMQDHENIDGWIVDLRNNSGGNMWPMLAGVGPILGEGVAGFFFGPDGTIVPWSYTNGISFLDATVQVRVTDPYELINPDPKVAVLLDQLVASSGEAIAIAFIGRDQTTSFGTATCGLSTANRGFALSDGSTLLLTTATMADRNQTAYGNAIEPDVQASSENVLHLAIDFIND